ncbi:MAG: protein kinase [Candidatus Neomarinimicrobiota bacterium]
MIGKTITHYKILEKLGEGGMGDVYKAEDTKLKRIVALKFLPLEVTRDKEMKQRFVHEARAASALDHPNICNIHEIDETKEGQIFICMGYYEGETVEEKAKQGPLKIGVTLDITIQIAQGLDKAHQSKIIHRDIKAANIIVTTDGVVKIVDFGIAKLAGQTRVTKDGTSLGTASYMSPEQTLGNEVDHRTDIWSLGVVLYEMLTGLTPFKGDYEQAVVFSILNEDPEPLTGLRTGVPMELERIVSKTMAKNPAERYQNVNDLVIDLRSVAKELESGTTKAKLTTTAKLRKNARSSFFKNLLERHIPQILGLYFAVSFGIIKFVQWLAQQYPISPNLPQFSFVALVSMFPTVYLLTYFHGKPGHDRRTRFEKIGIPTNLLASTTLLFFLFHNKDLGAATETISFKDKEGETVERMIPKNEFRHRIAIFTFKNKSGDSNLDWLQYGIMDLIDFDLDQDMYLTNISGLYDRFEEAGYDGGAGAPLAFTRKVAQDALLPHFVTGSFNKQSDVYSVNVRLYDSKRGMLISENSFSGSNLFLIADSVTVQLRYDLKTPAYHLENTPDLPVSEVLTSSMAALTSYVAGTQANFVDEAYETAAQHLENAIREDSEFAFAHYWLYNLYTDLNKRDAAEKSIRAAMRVQYKLPEVYQFSVKNSFYEVQGDWQGAFENAKHWVELYPYATQGHYTLASHYQRMNQLDMAIAEYKRILEIEPGSHYDLRNIGDLLSQKGEYNQALKYYEHYADLYPNDSGSFTEIGDLYGTMGDHEQAKLYFKKALLIKPEESGIVTALANTEKHLGNFEQASQQYQNALKVAKIPQERSSVYVSLSNYFEFRGQLDKAIEYWDLYIAEMQKFASPLAILMEGELGYIDLYVTAGKEDLAMKIVKEFETQAHQLGPPLNQLPFFFDIIFNFTVDDPETGAVLEEELEKLEAFIQTYNWEEARGAIWWGRAKLDYYREEYSQAITGFQKAAETTIGQGEKVFLISLIGECYRKLKAFEEAKETLQKALKLEPFSPRAHYELALVYWEQDEKQQAMEHLNTTLNVWEEADAEYKPAKAAREKLAVWEMAAKSN